MADEPRMLVKTGKLIGAPYGEYDSTDIGGALWLEDDEYPLAEELEDITGKQVTCRYWITDKQVSRDEAQEAFLHTLMGTGEAHCKSAYSEITGYLWTDEDLNIGGHDLLAELSSHLGKWLILEIEIH